METEVFFITLILLSKEQACCCYFRVILTLDEYLHFYYKLSLDKGQPSGSQPGCHLQYSGVPKAKSFFLYIIKNTIFKMSSNLKWNCYEFATGCSNFYLSSVGQRSVLCGYWNLIIRSAPKNFIGIRIRSWSENFAQNIIRSRSENTKPSSYQIAITITIFCHICWI